MSTTPPSRTASAFAGAWPRLVDEFDEHLQLGAKSEAVRAMVDHDLPVRTDLVPDAAALPLNVTEVEEVELHGLDRLARLLQRTPTRAKSPAGQLGRRAADSYVRCVEDVLVGLSPRCSPTTVHDAVAGLRGRRGALWVTDALWSTWSLRGNLERFGTCHPEVSVRPVLPHARHPRVSALLMPVDERLMARNSLVPLTLSWDNSPTPGYGLLHAWCHEELHVADDARHMVQWWHAEGGTAGCP